MDHLYVLIVLRDTLFLQLVAGYNWVWSWNGFLISEIWQMGNFRQVGCNTYSQIFSSLMAPFKYADSSASGSCWWCWLFTTSRGIYCAAHKEGWLFGSILWRCTSEGRMPPAGFVHTACIIICFMLSPDSFLKISDSRFLRLIRLLRPTSMVETRLPPSWTTEVFPLFPTELH